MQENIFQRAIKTVSEKIYKHMEHGSGNMILLTTIIGISLSSLAQTCAILTNNKYSTSQKAFMAPQELTEGSITILSMFLITKPLQKLASKYVSTGKILTKDVKNYLKEQNLLEKRGDFNLDIKSHIQKTITDIEKTDKYIKSSTMQKKNLLSKYEKASQSYESTLDATSAIATTAGSIISTTLVAPFLRNKVAAESQKISLRVLETKDINSSDNSKKTNITFKSNHTPYASYNKLRI